MHDHDMQDGVVCFVACGSLPFASALPRLACLAAAATVLQHCTEKLYAEGPCRQPLVPKAHRKASHDGYSCCCLMMPSSCCSCGYCIVLVLALLLDKSNGARFHSSF